MRRPVQRMFGVVLAAGFFAVLGDGLVATADAQTKPVRAAAIFSIPNPRTVNGWDRGQYEGIQRLIQKYGWEVTIAESVPFPRLAETASNYAAAGYDVVIFTSSGHIGAWKEVAPKYPKTWFVMMSAVDELPTSPNVVAYTPDFYGYGAMVGAVGAATSKTNRIAAVGGAPVHALIVMFSGLIEGAKAVRQDIEVLTAFSGSWTDVPKVREVTTVQVQRGADVIFACAGLSTRGILEGAEAGGVWTVGYATDWYADSPSTLTSLVMNIPGWYERFAKDLASNALRPQIVTFGTDTFEIARGRIPPDQEKQVRSVLTRIQRGEIVVPKKVHKLN